MNSIEILIFINNEILRKNIILNDKIQPKKDTNEFLTSIGN